MRSATRGNRLTLLLASAIAAGVVIGVVVLPVPSAPGPKRAPQVSQVAVMPAAVDGGKVTAMALGPDGLLGLGTDRGRVFIWSWARTRTLQPAVGEKVADGSISSITFSGDGNTMAGLSQNGTFWAWHRGHAPLSAHIPREASYASAFSTEISLDRDGSNLAVSNSGGNRLYVYGLGHGAVRPFLVARYALHSTGPLGKGPSNPVFGAHGRKSAHPRSCKIGPGQADPSHVMYVTCPDGYARLSTNGDTAAIGIFSFVEIWNVRTGQQAGDRLAPAPVISFALSGDGGTLAIGTVGQVLVFDLRVDRPPARIQLNHQHIFPACFYVLCYDRPRVLLSPDGSLLLIMPLHGRSTIWSIRK